MMENLVVVCFAALFFFVGRLSTTLWRTADQNDREEWIDYWARQREKPTCEVSYDWRKNQRQTRYSAAVKALMKER